MSTSNSCCVHVAENVQQRPLVSHFSMGRRILCNPHRVEIRGPLGPRQRAYRSTSDLDGIKQSVGIWVVDETIDVLFQNHRGPRCRGPRLKRQQHVELVNHATHWIYHRPSGGVIGSMSLCTFSLWTNLLSSWKMPTIFSNHFLWHL